MFVVRLSTGFFSVFHDTTQCGLVKCNYLCVVRSIADSCLAFETCIRKASDDLLDRKRPDEAKMVSLESFRRMEMLNLNLKSSRKFDKLKIIRLLGSLNLEVIRSECKLSRWQKLESAEGDQEAPFSSRGSDKPRIIGNYPTHSGELSVGSALPPTE